MQGTGGRVATRTLRLGGVSREFAQPLTFTPYAAATPCTARCRFCSETFVPRGEPTTSAALRPGPGYFTALARVLTELRTLPMGLSLSGLEATSDPTWLSAVLATFADHLRAGGCLDERVLYTNGSGFADRETGEALVAALAAIDLTRVELSRHALGTAENDAIMRFRPGVAIRDRDTFTAVARRIAAAFPLRMVCVVQRGGVATPRDVARYAAWALALGAQEVVFRELARLDDTYRPTRSVRVVDDTRVPIESVLAFWRSDQGGAELRRFDPECVVAGYYYWSLRFRDAAGRRIIFETSDYATMKQCHRSEVVHKLVFHPNGSLGADWSPFQRILVPAEAREEARVR